MIVLQGLEWARLLVTQVFISPYRDGLLMDMSGPTMPAGLAVHLDEEDDVDDILYNTFPNLTVIVRKPNPKIDRVYPEDSEI